ncbi:MAG TPA: MarR family transcriptional regulator [Chloroflexia bacterium]|nr:MarR family transcriptional regulator [Chloroflexia bacterium]
MDNLKGVDNNIRINKIVELDRLLQLQLKSSWPEGWLQLNLPLGSTRALLAIEGGYANTPSGIAEKLRVGRTNVTGMLDRLEAEGLITRLLDPNDKRSFILEATEKGRELVRQIDAVRSSQLEHALHLMDSDDLEALSRGLQALTEAMRTTLNNLSPVTK